MACSWQHCAADPAVAGLGLPGRLSVEDTGAGITCTQVLIGALDDIAALRPSASGK
jgi:hypothetical protein